MYLINLIKVNCELKIEILSLLNNYI